MAEFRLCNVGHDNTCDSSLIMAGHSRPKDGVASARLCPAIHVLARKKEDVDARHKAGHDAGEIKR
jgi:hypothetical protein